MNTTYIPPRRLPKRIMQGVIPAKQSCVKCGGKLTEFTGEFKSGYRCERCGWMVEISTGRLRGLKKAFYKSVCFVNGWKTAAGLVVACIGTFFVSGPAGVWLQAAGYAIGGIGGTHKAVKIVNSVISRKKAGNSGERDLIDIIIEILGKLKVLLKGGEK